MTIIRSPIRSTTRSPLRGALDSKFGDSAPPNPLSISVPGAYVDLFSSYPLDIGATITFSDTEDVGGNYVATLTATSGTTLTATGWTGTGTNSITRTDTIANLNSSIDLASELVLGIAAAGNDDIILTFVRSADSAAASPRVIEVLALPVLAASNLAEDTAVGTNIDTGLTTALSGSSATLEIVSQTTYTRPTITSLVLTDNTDGTIDIDFTTDTVDGDVDYVVTSDTTTPVGGASTQSEIDNIIAGNDLQGTTTDVVASGTIVGGTAGAKTIPNVNCSANGLYHVFIAHRADEVDGDGDNLDSILEYDTVTVTGVSSNWWESYFSSSEDGRVYLPAQHKVSDCLWTDASRTTAATNGDLVKVIDDLSGNSEHITFDDARRPTYRSTTDSVEFIDDAGTFDYGSWTTGIASKTIAVSAEATANDQAICYALGGTGVGVFSGGTFGGVNGWGIFDGSNIRSSTVEDTSAHYTTIFADGATNSELRVDGSSILTSQINTPTLTMMGARPDSLTNAFEGHVYGVFIHEDDLNASTTDIETEMAAITP